jgi:type IV fimbrial biogenesis protein FimT
VRGFTLLELMVVISVTGILLAVAVPSFGAMLARMRLEGAGNELATDLQYSRSEASRRRANVNLASAAGGAGYNITSGATTLKSVTMPSGVTLSASVTATFEPLRGLSNAASWTASNSTVGVQLQVSTDVMGRVTLCSPGGSFRAYTTC